MSDERRFVIDVDRSDGACVVRVEGEVDLDTAPGLSTCIERLAREGVPEVVLDLRDVPYLDSTGLSALARGVSALAGGGGHLRVRSPNPSARKLIELTNLDKVLTVEER